MAQARLLTPGSTPATVVEQPRAERGDRRVRRLGFAVGLLVVGLCFSRTARDLCEFAWDSSLYSHAPLVPLIALYLARTRRASAPAGYGRSVIVALAAGISAAALAALPWLCLRQGAPLAANDALASEVLAPVLAIYGLVGWFFGERQLRHFAFPLGFLLFMVPLPTRWIDGIESVLQHGSAAVARGLFRLSGTPVYYEQLNFQLPGVSLHVAPECSGIHSSIALLIVSLLAAHWFLRSTPNRLLIAAAVFPLALVRNGFRIFTVGQLCVHGGPAMIDSPIHRQGGPLFFALSLVPFFVLLLALVHRESRARAASARA